MVDRCLIPLTKKEWKLNHNEINQGQLAEWLKWKRQTITTVDNNKEVKEPEFSLIPDKNVKSCNLFGELGS